MQRVSDVKLSLKRTVWGVVTSATANSCPSANPNSSTHTQIIVFKNHGIYKNYNAVNLLTIWKFKFNCAFVILMAGKDLTFQSFAEIGSCSFFNWGNGLKDTNKTLIFKQCKKYNKHHFIQNLSILILSYLQVERFIFAFKCCSDSWGLHLTKKQF